MKWRVEFLDEGVRAELDALPVDIRASFLRITRLIEAEGIHKLREPYVKHLEGPVWEMRMKGRDRITQAPAPNSSCSWQPTSTCASRTAPRPRNTSTC